MSSTSSTYDNFTLSSFEQCQKKYTVQNTESSSDFSRGENGEQENSLFLYMAKWITAVFLFLAVLTCIVTSKISFLILGQQFKSFNQTSTMNNTTNESTAPKKQALFMMLVLILTVPQAVSFVYAMWASFRRKSHRWPTSRSLLLILIGGFIESLSLCYISILMPTVLPVSVDSMVLLMCSLVLAPAVWQILKSKWSTRRGIFHAFKFALAAILALQGLVVFTWEIPSMSGKIGLPLAFLLLSIAWSPKMRKLQTQIKIAAPVPTDGSNTYDGEYGFSAAASVVKQGGNSQRRTYRGKAAIILSLWKLVLTPLIALSLSKIYGIVELETISAGFDAMNTSNPSFFYFVLHVFVSFAAYHFGWLACSLCMQPIGYALPLTLATPIVLIVTHVRGVCDTSLVPLSCNSIEGKKWTLVAGVLLWLSQLLVATCYVWKSQGLTMARAHALLWIPSYNSAFLEQFLLLNRRNKAADGEHVTQKHLSRDTNVFICTTMYHEEDYEMEQLLRSLHDIDTNSWKTGRHVESHIFFDGCIRAEVLNSFVLQLVSLVEGTLKVLLGECARMKTPYGMELRWVLPGGMAFTIHLKDNDKVKNKKRWSQVMYMSYVLDYKQRLLGVRDDQSFILTTDADVKFTHESMEALIDQMTQDPRIGAVCARTHPLGSGPMVWYQVFDYAIGHWFQKVANHVFGSVLCSPGCFSLYRCQAVRDILPTYATSVDHAFEFLTKDMGEDRWMCTLMIQHGWLLTYCAAAEDSTYCPDNFEEFYKQRRRWMPSTLANLLLLVSQWKLMLRNNEHISFFFIVYQSFLVCSTIIGPSTVILVIVGGLAFSGIGANELTTLFLMCIVVLAFSLVCLFTSQEFQLKVAKLLTFVFAIIMIMVVIGVAVQISSEINDRKTPPTVSPTLEPNTTILPVTKPLEHHLPAGVSTLYLAGLTGIFIGGAALHPSESLCLLNGVWYLLCLPSGYLFLTIYSLCNMTDRSWGTREGKSASESKDWFKIIRDCLRKWCCLYCRKKINCLSPVSNQARQETTNGGESTSATSKAPNAPDQIGNSENITTPITGDNDQANSTDIIGLSSSEDNLSDEVFDAEVQTSLNANAAIGDTDLLSGSNCYSLPINTQMEDAKKTSGDPAIFVYKEEATITLGSEKKSNVSAIEVVKTACEGAMGHCQKQREAGAETRCIKTFVPAGPNPLDSEITNSTIDQHSIDVSVDKEELGTSTHQFNDSNEDRDSDGEAMVGHAAAMNNPTSCSDSNDHHTPQKNKQWRLLRYSSVANLTPGTSTTTLSNSSESSSSKLSSNDHDDGWGSQSVSSESQWTSNSEAPFKYDSCLSIRTYDENGHPMIQLRNEMSAYDVNLPIDAWLTGCLTRYIPNFRKHGYDKVGFLPGITDKDLQMIGIETRGHRQRLLRAIRKIPRADTEGGVPENVEDWLEENGLDLYWPKFRSSGYTEPSDLEDLKDMGKENLREMFHVHKPGHCNKLMSIIRKLQYPNQGQMKVRRARRELDRLPLLYMDVDNQDEGVEYEFWEGLRQTCLIPELTAFGQTSELKEKLVELRNKTLLVFGITNALWMIIILTLVQHKSLKLLGVDVVGLGFLTVYGFIFLLQFLALLLHRCRTVIHLVARTPWKPGKQVDNSRVSAPDPSPPADLPFAYSQSVPH